MLEYLKRVFASDAAGGQAIVSALLLLTFVIARIALARAIRRLPAADHQQRLRWLAQTRNVLIALAMVGLVLVWASELRTFALSVAAIAAALVLATKELIQSITGGILRASARSYVVGDRIEIGKVRGDVVDVGFVTTTLLEIGPGHQWTGRSVVIPNAQLLSQEVVNETNKQAFVLHIITVPLPSDADWEAAEEVMLEVAAETCEPFQDEATEHLSSAAKREGIDAPNSQPRIMLQLPAPDRVELWLRVPAPSRDKGRVEQSILREFLRRRSEWTSSSAA
jgi:small-conductance mechanosensitive channel